MDYNNMTVESLSNYIFEESHNRINKADIQCRIEHLIEKGIDDKFKVLEEVLKLTKVYPMQNNATPQWQHDCDKCKFLGTYTKYDLYFHKGVHFGDTVIARFGNEGRNYASGLELATMNRSIPLYVAKLRAIEKGYIVETN